jgi:hypothetical protein
MTEWFETLGKRAKKLFEKRMTLHSQWQEIADHFYVERADFTVNRNLGADLTRDMSTSFPMICCRDLGNSISSMLRPRAQPWFAVTVNEPDDLSSVAKEWLEGATTILRRMLYDPHSGFVRAMKEADRDFVTFGQAVISVELNRKKNCLMFRNWHLRDVAWVEDYDGSICEIFRKSKTTVQSLSAQFDGNISDKYKRMLEKDPDAEACYYHVVMPKERYKGEQKFLTKYVSVYFEEGGKHLLKEEAAQTMIYVIPRWQTVSGSQYAHSPATVAALPDSRLLQSMALDVLDAGERATDPLMFARKEIFRGDINRSGGVQFIDLEVGEKVSDALAFAPTDTSGLSRAFELMDAKQNEVKRAFFLDRINVPQPQGQGTAYEMSLLNAEYIRNALPLFEPMEQDYNAPVCEAAFAVAFENGAFGLLGGAPEEIAGRNIEFKFESPIHEAIEAQKAQMLLESIGIIGQVAAVDQSVTQIMRYDVAIRDSFEGKRIPTKWMRDAEEMEQMKQQEDAQAQAQQQIALIQQGGAAAEQVGAGAAALQAGGMV